MQDAALKPALHAASGTMHRKQPGHTYQLPSLCQFFKAGPSTLASLVVMALLLVQLTDKHPMVITRSEGVYVFDDTGKKYLDGLAGLWSTALGGSEGRLVDAADRQMRVLPFYHSFWNRTTEPAIQLAKVPRVQLLYSGSQQEGQCQRVSQCSHRGSAGIGDRKLELLIAQIPNLCCVCCAPARALSGADQHVQL